MTTLFVLFTIVGLAQLAAGVTELRTGRVVLPRPGVRSNTLWRDGTNLAGIGAAVGCGCLLQLVGLPGPGTVVLIGGMIVVDAWGLWALVRERL